MGDPQSARSQRLEERLAREIGLALALFAVALVQVTLLTGPAGFSIPVLLVLAIARALVGAGTAMPVHGLIRGLWWAFYGGVALDLAGTLPLGSHALAHLAAVAIVALLFRRLVAERPVVALLAVLVGAVVYELVLLVIVLPPATEWRAYIQVVILPSLLLALIPTLPIMALMNWLVRSSS